jgi:carotenoid 1,2-hydratase
LGAPVPGDGGSALRAGDAWRDGELRPAGLALAPAGALLDGGQRPSGAGRTDGGALGAAGGAERARGPRFDIEVAPGGYAWWYVDALSDDGRYGLSVIAFIGSVFSPYYAFARRRGLADPLDHCALNVALYGPRARRWTMTERSRRHVAISPERLAIGPSAISWDGTALTIAIDEIGMPLPIPRRVRGTVRVEPRAITDHVVTLNAEGAHRWWPIAPAAKVEVELSEPALRWSGPGYFDMNQGDAPLAEGFRDWHWSRAPMHEGAAVLYGGTRRDGSLFDFGWRFDRDGRPEPIEPPPAAKLPMSGWRISRETRSDAGHPATLVETMEDTPFYARSLVRTSLGGENVTAMHESLSLDRFANPVVQAMLPFKMPRRG